jgi:hypothetical protein
MFDDLLQQQRYALDAGIAVTKVTTKPVERKELNTNLAFPPEIAPRPLAIVIESGSFGRDR